MGTLDISDLVALAMVVLVGLPHGAFDAAVANYLGASRNSLTAVRFFFLYFLAAASVTFLWIIFPGPSLAIFLAISMLHFGLGDANADSLPTYSVQIIAHGGVVVFGIIFYHAEEVTFLFDLLTVGGVAPAFWLANTFAQFLPIVILIYAGLAIAQPEVRTRFFELIILAVIFFFLSPLVGFAVYFCFIHTGRHMHLIWKKLRLVSKAKVLCVQAAGFTLMSWLLGAGAIFSIGSDDLDVSILRVVFIGLASLTVPHMVLVDGFFRKEIRISERI